MTMIRPTFSHRNLLHLGAALIASVLAMSSPARAVVELNITQGTIQPLPIAIADFAGDGSIDPKTAREIQRTRASRAPCTPAGVRSLSWA